MIIFQNNIRILEITIKENQEMELTQQEVKDLAQSLTTPLIVFDLETTGVDLVRDEIVQFYGIRIEPNGESKTLEFLCKPSIQIPQEASNVHGITNERVANEKPFRSYVPG
jgi:DNA polymerase III epsilon subunit-like protein